MRNAPQEACLVARSDVCPLSGTRWVEETRWVREKRTSRRVEKQLEHGHGEFHLRPLWLIFSASFFCFQSHPSEPCLGISRRGGERCQTVSPFAWLPCSLLTLCKITLHRWHIRLVGHIQERRSRSFCYSGCCVFSPLEEDAHKSRHSHWCTM